MKIKQHRFFGVFLIDSKIIATLNLVPGKRVYGEQLFKLNDKEYREWIPFRSKPAAAIKCGLKVWPIEKNMKILYLGCGSGTTCSHFSDIIDREGVIYAIDVAERPMRDMIKVAESRGNIIPILGDGRKPEDYENTVLEKVDLVYEDVADPDQMQIMVRNSKKFLKPNGFAMIAIKSQSIDVTKDPRAVYKECLEEFKKHFEILDKVELDPYERDHMFVVMKKK